MKTININVQYYEFGARSNQSSPFGMSVCYISLTYLIVDQPELEHSQQKQCCESFASSRTLSNHISY